MAEPAHTGDDGLARVARVVVNLPLDDAEAVVVADALETLREGLDALVSEDLQNIEAPLRFIVDPHLR